MADFCDQNEHLGHVLLNYMKKRRQDDTFMIDGWTGSSETVGGVVSSVVRLARALRRLGLRPGAPLALAGRNHNTLLLPYYAAMLNGLPVLAMDSHYQYDVIKTFLKRTEPKIFFCQSEYYKDYTQVSRDLGIDVKIVTFDEGENSMSKFLDTYGDDTPVHDFEPAEFDVSKVYAWLVSTSGSTGVPKLAAFGHPRLVRRLKKFIAYKQNNDSTPGVFLHMSTAQWISSYIATLAWPLANYTLLHSSRPDPYNADHIVDLINKYKPTAFAGSFSVMSLALKSKKYCDFSCFKEIIFGGMNVDKKTITDLRARTTGEVVETYATTESIGLMMKSTAQDPIGCVGTPLPGFTFKLVYSSTGDEIRDPYVNGELWFRGPCFEEYYKDPQETAKAFHEGWYKTGDLLYRDELDRYYFVARMVTIIRYQEYDVIASELEEVLAGHPAVRDVAVTSVPHAADGQRAVAAIVTRPGANVTAQDIKDFIADALPKEKHLHGGVIFVDQLPKTSTGKVAHAKLRDIIQDKQIE